MKIRILSNNTPALPARPASLPVLRNEQKLDLKSLRHPTENLFLGWIIGFNCLILGTILVVVVIAGIPAVVGIAVMALFLFLLNKLTFVLAYWYLHGNSIRVSQTQYPEVYNAVKTACEYIDLKPVPNIYVFHGHGLMELFIMKRFSRKGILLFTSELIDNLLDAGDSRELMMLIGRQLGHLKLGHFRWWFFTDVVGVFFIFVHQAWWRRCHYSADRVGFLIAGDLEASRRALIVLAVGKKLALATRLAAIEEQEDELHDSFFAWFAQVSYHYPFIIRRIIALESFRDHVVERAYNPAATMAVGALPPEANRFNVINVYGEAIFGDHGMIAAGRTV